jgi:hypothetical protein
VDNGGGLSVGAIIGIVAAPCVLAALVLLVLRKKGYLGGKDLEDKGKINGTRSMCLISLCACCKLLIILVMLILRFCSSQNSVL